MKAKKFRNSVAVRFMAILLMMSLIVTVLLSTFELNESYKREVDKLNKTIDSIKISNIQSLSDAIFNIDEQQIQLICEGIIHLNGIAYLKLTLVDAEYEYGVLPPAENRVIQVFDIEHADSLNPSEMESLGQLYVVASTKDAESQYYNKMFSTILAQGAIVFIIAITIAILFRVMVLRHVNRIVDYANHFKIEDLETELALNERTWLESNQDEFAQMATAFNRMRSIILSELEQRKLAERENVELNRSLEQKVIERTQALEQSNLELTGTLQKLEETYQQLIEHEKMASLGGLVAGVAHEINTPVGLTVTTASFIKEKADDVKRTLEEGKLKRSSLEGFVNTAAESLQIILTNMNRASELIRSFKHVAVDQTSEEKRLFNMKKYLDELVLSLRPKIKKRPISVSVVCDNQIEIYSDPGSYAHVFTNLIMNSLTHAYDEEQSGHITIEVVDKGDELYLEYSDDGKGVPEEHIKNIFDPFFTTRRGSGGSGLGLHVAYNNIIHRLNGTIAVESAVGEGVTFKMTVPKE